MCRIGGSGTSQKRYVDHRLQYLSIINIAISPFSNLSRLFQTLFSAGVFGPEKRIEWCVVVTTPEEVHICALAASASSDKQWTLIPTSFVVPTDGIHMLSIAGTKDGRIFLGGEDGSLYEMSYEGRISDRLLREQEKGVDFAIEDYLDRFYNQGKVVPAQITTDAQHVVVDSSLSLGKRAWTAVAPTEQPRKCRKLNRSSGSSLLSAIMPEFLTTWGSGKSQIVQIKVDMERQTLYTLSSKGWICTYDIRSSSFRLTATMDSVKTARTYLEAVSRGQSFPPNTHMNSSLGSISFPGGSSAAQAGVGGMDGARTILKAACVADLLRPASIHVLDPTESARLTLVAVTAGGLRFYLSSLQSTVLNHGPTTTMRKSRAEILAPSGRISFCHIRVPPAADGVPTVGGMEGAIPPRWSKMQRVNASVYQNGCWVAAVEHTAGANGNKTVGSVLIATCPDSAARKVDEENSKKSKDRLVVPGGVSESVSLPMASAYGEDTNNANAVVPDGVVWDMAIIPEPPSTVMRLTAQSQTPTDSELRVGLPPAYFPPSRVRARTLSNALAMRNSQQTTALGVSNDANPWSVLTNVMANLIFSKPIRDGIISPRALRTSPQQQECYRISQRDGSRGFSLTAAERATRTLTTTTRRTNSAATPSTTKSARLRQSLLQPWSIPLNRFSTQHLVRRPQKMVAINVGGLHYFQLDSLLEELAKAILAAGENLANDPNVTRFFTSYGYKEGCAMCLSLAVGCGPTASSVGSEEVKRRAMDAALARAFVPKLVISAPESENNKFQTSSVEPADQFVPTGYEFKPSALSEALTATFSRLVRPVWNRPMVVVTEGPVIRQRLSTTATTAPAKVEILVDEQATEEINRPLRNLQAIMKTRLARAIRSIPGVSQHPDRMDVDDATDQSHYLTRVLQYSSQQGQSGDAVQLTAAGAKNIAHLIEEKNIHSLYRLLSRVVQLLNLISLLRHAQASRELREVDWGLLHGLTIAQLAQTPEGQDRLETLLNALVTASASDRSSQEPDLSAQADQLASTFAEQCYLFFSPGSRYAYLGLRKASGALLSHSSSSQRVHLAREAAQHFYQAAQHWHSAALITGRILHKKGQETTLQIAERAMLYGSPLAKAVDVLIQLNDVDSAVNICLAVASNFKKVGNAQESLVDSFGTNQIYDLAWEQNLYHKRRDVVESGGSNGTNGSSFGSPSSSSQIAAYGADVGARDAVDTCYALIFYHLSQLLQSKNQQLATSMVSVCAGASDGEFLSTFFLYLLNNDHKDTLLKINSPELEEWLRARKDPDLLGRYFTVQGRHKDAGDVLWEKGSDATSQLPLSDRIECLSKARNSFEKALFERHQAARFSSEQDGDLAQKAKVVEDSLQIACIQNRILHTLDTLGSELPADITVEDHARLKNCLVPVTDLYNEYAVKMDLFEICLDMLRICRSEDHEALSILWRHIISKEILPCVARRDTNYSFLQSLVADIGRGDDVHTQETSDDSLPVYENGDWIKRLEAKMVSLGQQLYGKGADFVFPLRFLLEHLEGKTVMYHDNARGLARRIDIMS